MTDGGAGRPEALGWHRPVQLEALTVIGPAGRPVTAHPGLHDGGSCIASAQACGLRHSLQREPLQATSYGVGQLLRAAKDPIRIGLGGSATIDCGLGMLQALGVLLQDHNRQSIPAPIRGGQISKACGLVGRIPPLPPVEVLLDVETPLVDAVPLYSPQKGHRPRNFAGHTTVLMHSAARINAWRQTHGRSPISDVLPGSGAAGGLGFALSAVGATLTAGAAAFARLTRLPPEIAGVDAAVVEKDAWIQPATRTRGPVRSADWPSRRISRCGRWSAPRDRSLRHRWSQTASSSSTE